MEPAAIGEIEDFLIAAGGIVFVAEYQAVDPGDIKKELKFGA